MTIQLSVTVWTVICFIVFMLVLKHLLFKPVLEVIDNRREKIRGAQEKHEMLEKERIELESVLEENKKRMLERRDRELKEAIENVRTEGKNSLDRAREERIKLVDSYHAELQVEQERMLSALSEKSTELATVFADNVTKE